MGPAAPEGQASVGWGEADSLPRSPNRAEGQDRETGWARVLLPHRGGVSRKRHGDNQHFDICLKEESQGPETNNASQTKNKQAKPTVLAQLPLFTGIRTREGSLIKECHTALFVPELDL